MSLGTPAYDLPRDRAMSVVCLRVIVVSYVTEKRIKYVFRVSECIDGKVPVCPLMR